MALELETSRAFRSIDELTRLIEAIAAAPATESEPDWLEWKREADLADRRWHAIIAKCIAGFANRDPAVAKRHASGCGYLVIGAEPRNVVGVKPVDNSQLHAGVSRFVGTALRWSPQYLATDGAQVLIITVESPEGGDPIVAMRAGYESHARGSSVCREGDVFVRRHGSTDRATHEDFDMLARRFATGTEQATGFRVGAVNPVTAVPVASGPNEVAAWRQRKKQALLEPLEGGAQLTVRLGLFPNLEQRTADEYRSEVESYLDEAAALLPRDAHADALMERSPGMQLVLINDTEHNFSEVRVKVTVDADVRAYTSDLDARPQMPRPPRSWGAHRWSALHDLVPTGPVIFPGSPSGPYIDNSGSTSIEFDDVDLRPSGQVRLRPIHLVAGAALAGETVTAAWAATSSSADGVARGEFPITISQEIVSPLD